MPHTEPLDLLPLWAFVALTLALVYTAVECGVRLGRYRRQVSEAEKEATIGPIVGATMGLLAFMLAFTFGLAASRFDARRKVLVDEANAVGTAYLRAGFLEAARRDDARAMLRRYVDGRLAILETGDFERLRTESAEIHAGLWRQVEAAAAGDPRSVPIGLFTSAVNDVIDIHSTRWLVAVQGRIPTVLWFTLYLSAGCSMFVLGYHVGLSNSRRSLSVAALAVAFTSVLLLIADLDRPREGVIQVNQQAFLDLRDAWAQDAATAASS